MAYSYKGAISFGLVNIPIILQQSIKQNDISFNMLDKKTMSKIKYKKTCVDCNNREVKNEDIVKGFQYEKDKYVIFEEEDFEKIKSEKDKNITIDTFVNLKDVDPIFIDKTYYVEPNGSDKAFNLLLLSMEKLKKAGIAKTVLGIKDTLILLWIKNGKMLLSTLFYYEEIKNAPNYKKEKITSKEIELATSLINNMQGKFEPQKYKDDYNTKIQKAIKQKISGKQIITSETKPKQQKVINLMEALKQSLKTSEKSTKKVKKSIKEKQAG